MMEMSPQEEIDLINLIAKGDVVSVSECIRATVIRVMARDLKTFGTELLKSLSDSNLWGFFC